MHLLSRRIAYIDTLDVCHLRCPTCMRGVRGMANTTERMDLALYDRIVGRLRDQGFRRLGLYNWSEPFLNPALDAFVARATARGLRVSVSSTLSLPRIANLEAALRAGIDLLIVSMSGADQQTYEVNHVGGVLEQVTANLRRVREVVDRHRLRTRVRLRMLAFDYNAHHEQPLRALARGLDFGFERITGIGHPRPGLDPVPTNEHYVAEGLRPPAGPSPEDLGRACDIMFNQMAIDCRGDVYLCCAMPNYPTFRLGSFLDLSSEQLLVSKFAHPNCRTCPMPRRRRTFLEKRRLARAFHITGAA